MKERSLLMRVVRRLAFGLVFGVLVGTLSHVAWCANRYYLGSALVTATRADGSRMGFIEYTVYRDPWLGIGTLVVTFAVAMWKGRGDWIDE